MAPVIVGGASTRIAELKLAILKAAVPPFTVASPEPPAVPNGHIPGLERDATRHQAEEIRGSARSGQKSRRRRPATAPIDSNSAVNAVQLPPPSVEYCQTPCVSSTAVTAMPSELPFTSVACPAISVETNVPELAVSFSAIVVERIGAGQHRGVVHQDAGAGSGGAERRRAAVGCRVERTARAALRTVPARNVSPLETGPEKFGLGSEPHAVRIAASSSACESETGAMSLQVAPPSSRILPRAVGVVDRRDRDAFGLAEVGIGDLAGDKRGDEIAVVAWPDSR